MKGWGRLRSWENGQKSRWSERSKRRGLVKEMNILRIKELLGFKSDNKRLKRKRCRVI